MPDETPNGSPEPQNPGPADTSNSGMPDEVSAYLSEMTASLGLDTVQEGGSSRETPGNDDDRDQDLGSREGPGDDSDDAADPTTDDDGADERTGMGDDGDDGLPGDLPERVRQALKDLPRQVKGELFKHVKTTVRTEVQGEIETARQTADRLAKEKSEREAATAEIRSRNARFIGLEEVTTPDGRTIPTYAEIERLLKTRGGDDVLDDKYGMSREEAQEQLEVWDERRQMVEGNQDWFDKQAWGKLSYFTIQGLKRVEGLDADAVMAGIETPDQVIDRVVAHLTTKHKAELETQRKQYEARIEGHGLNAEALKGRAAAGSLRSPDTGGRAGGGRAMTRERLERALENPDEFEKNRDAIYSALGL